MKREDEGWREIPGWEGGYDPKGGGSLEKEVNGFKLSIDKKPELGDKYIEGHVEANGCIERISPIINGGWERYYKMRGRGSPRNEKKIDKDIETIEDLAKYLEEYANALLVDEWIKGYQKQDISDFPSR